MRVEKVGNLIAIDANGFNTNLSKEDCIQFISVFESGATKKFPALVIEVGKPTAIIANAFGIQNRITLEQVKDGMTHQWTFPESDNITLITELKKVCEIKTNNLNQVL